MAKAGNTRGGVMPADQVARMADLRRGVRKARKIRRVLEDALAPRDTRPLALLDYGCGPAVIAAYLAKTFGRVVAADVDAATVATARTRYPSLELVTLTGGATAWPDASFDVILCNHVYEHVAEAAALCGELYRLVKPNGVVYLAAAGRWQVLEPHYRLPFLAWLPPQLADVYLRLVGRPERYDVRLVSWRRLTTWLEPFTVTEYTARILEEPRRFAALDLAPRSRFLRRAAGAVARRFPRLLPTRIFVLRKKIV